VVAFSLTKLTPALTSRPHQLIANLLKDRDIIRVTGHSSGHLSTQTPPKKEEVSDSIQDLVTHRLIRVAPLIVDRAFGTDQKEVIEPTTEREPLALKVSDIFYKAKGSRRRYLISIGGRIGQGERELLLANRFWVAKGVINAELISRLDADRLFAIPYFYNLLNIDLVPLTILLSYSYLLKEAAELTRGAVHNGNLAVTLDENVRDPIGAERGHKVLDRPCLSLTKPNGSGESGGLNEINVRGNNGGF
jgi:hypothetical protein